MIDIIASLPVSYEVLPDRLHEQLRRPRFTEHSTDLLHCVALRQCVTERQLEADQLVTRRENECGHVLPSYRSNSSMGLTRTTALAGSP